MNYQYNDNNYADERWSSCSRNYPIEFNTREQDFSFDHNENRHSDFDCDSRWQEPRKCNQCKPRCRCREFDRRPRCCFGFFRCF